MMGETPFGHDRAPTGNNAGNPLGRQRHIAQKHTGMNREVIHPLFGLLDQRVAINLPGQLFGNPIHFFQSLIDGHRANGHHGVANNPFARLMDILAGRQVHDGVGPPQCRPGQLLDLFFNRGTDRGISDIRVHFNQEITADNHRLDFRMVDVGRNDGATPRHLRADKLRGDFIRNLRAECLPQMLLARLTGLLELSASHVFADGDVFHLGRDNALAGIV